MVLAPIVAVPQLIASIGPAPRPGNVVYVMTFDPVPATLSPDRRFLYAVNAGSDDPT